MSQKNNHFTSTFIGGRVPTLFLVYSVAYFQDPVKLNHRKARKRTVQVSLLKVPLLVKKSFHGIYNTKHRNIVKEKRQKNPVGSLNVLDTA